MLLEVAREQMVEQQVRTWDVTDPRVLEALRTVPRERFVPERWRELACADCELPLPHGKHMLRPMLVGRLLQALAVQPGELALEIGSGSGYVSACLALLGARVRSLELHPDIASAARAHLGAFGPAAAVEVIEADGLRLAETGRYDVIVVTASLPIYQPVFERALRPGGRLFVVTGAGMVQEASLVSCAAAGQCATRTLFETRLEPLEGAPQPKAFAF